MHHTIGGPTSPSVNAQQRAALNRKSAAAYLSISTRLLDSLASQGKLPKVKINSKTLFRVIDLDQYLASKLEGGA